VCGMKRKRIKKKVEERKRGVGMTIESGYIGNKGRRDDYGRYGASPLNNT
jgi:hypothetical protein